VKPTKIDHLGIAVEDLNQAAKVYEAMGLLVARTADVPEQKVRVAFIPIGDTRIELVQPTSPDSAVARYLEQRGQGLHHVALQVDDIATCLADLKGQGLSLIDETPRQGAEGRIAFVHPKSTGGTLIELVEPD
jgi:methylmalonyl-CoA/ethylmalonyl-CoA epimerase